MMKWLLATFVVLTNAFTPKLCVHCKHFITDGACGPEFGKCRALPTSRVDNNYLVTGISTIKIDYSYCSTARQYEQLCGNTGKLFVKLDVLD